MSEYEQAICFSAACYPMVWVWEDKYTVTFTQRVKPFAVMVFYPHFPQMILDGYLERTEKFPTDGYWPGDMCREKAWELWKQAGRKPYYIEPGVLLAR